MSSLICSVTGFSWLQDGVVGKANNIDTTIKKTLKERIFSTSVRDISMSRTLGGWYIIEGSVFLWRVNHSAHDGDVWQQNALLAAAGHVGYLDMS
jgi:hypothetical protein